MIFAQVKRVQVYHWESPEGLVRFLIPRALEIIAQRPEPRPAPPFGLPDAVHAIRLNPHALTLNIAFAMTTDLTKPLIIATTPHGHVLIDGWHRVIKQILTRTKQVPTELLTPEETARCIIDASELADLGSKINP